MKKFTVSVLLSFAALSGLYAQSGEITGLINRNDLSNYNAFFKVKIGKVEVVADKYTSAPTDAEWERIAVLGGDTTDVDTAEEIAFLSYASGVVDIRPPEAAAMLPKSRESDLKIGALMYQNLQTAAFLRTANAAAYATLFNQFCAENNISKAEVKTYFDRNIAAAVAAEVDAQFNRVSFLLENYSTNSRISYDVVLTRTPTNQYVLKYDRASVQNDDKELSGTSLEALLAVMSRSGDFTQSAVNTVRAQAALIPAVVYADWSANHGVVNGLDTLKGALTDFYLAPNQANYNVLLGIYAKNRAIELGDQGNPEFPRAVLNSLVATLSGLNTHLAQKVTGDMQRVNIRNTALALTGAKYQAFDIPYATR